MKTILFSATFALVWGAAAQPVVNVSPADAKINLTIAQDEKAPNALVSDRRTASLAAGRSIVRFSNVASDLENQAAGVQPAFTGPAPVELWEQRFRFDARRAGGVLERFIGAPVSVVRPDGKQFSGTLLRLNQEWLLENAEGYVANANGTFLLPKLSDGLVTTPSLEWTINTRAAGTYAIEARYATSGLRWWPSYRATLAAGGDKLAFNAWLHVANNSGADFRDAQLSLQTGALSAKGTLIPYPRPVSLPSGESRQMSYLSGELAIQTELAADFSGGRFEENRTLVPMLSVRLKNDTASGLGVPLPEGALTVLQQSASGALRLLNERRLAPLAIGEDVLLPLSDVPEITVARVVTVRRLNPKVTETSVTFTIENKRKEAATLIVRDSLPVGAKVTETSQEPEAKGVNTQRFRVVVPAEGKAEVKYVLQIGA
jgi:hypothetical protein